MDQDLRLFRVMEVVGLKDFDGGRSKNGTKRLDERERRGGEDRRIREGTRRKLKED